MSTLFHTALYLFYLALFVWLIFKWSFFEMDGVQRKHFAFFFLLKVAAGIFLTLIYTYYYTDQLKADIYRYFNDSKIISPLLFSHPVVWLKIMTGYGINEPAVFQYLLPTQYFSHPGSDMVTNNTFVIRLNVLFNYFSFSNIYINTLFVNFISFASLTALFKTLKQYFSGFQELLYLPLFLLPAVLFWSSGLLKEPLLFAGVSLYLVAVLSEAGLLRRSLMGIAGALVIFLIKPHVLVVLLLCSLFLPGRKFSVSVLTRAMVLLVLLVAGIYFFGDHAGKLLIEKRNEFVELATAENAGSYFDSQIITPSLTNLLKLLPEAFVNSVLRPFIWDGGKFFQKVFAVENLLFLIILLIPLRYFKMPQSDRLLLCLCFLLFAVLNYLIIGITVPVMGAIVHYRVIAAPFLLMAVLLCVDLERWRNALRY